MFVFFKLKLKKNASRPKASIRSKNAHIQFSDINNNFFDYKLKSKY